jgi:monofunctional glycosyltransferase
MPARETSKRRPIPRAGNLRGRRRPRHLFRAILGALLISALSLYAMCVLFLLALRWVNPPTTTVQIQRHVEAMWQHRAYKKHYDFVALHLIAPSLQQAVVAAEDGRFLQHHGFDWVEMQKVLESDMKNQKLGRGGSTITQQLVKNLFLTTERSVIRKAAEFSLVPVMEAFLTKKRILELYLNVIEWGPGIYGAEAASEYYYHVHASAVNRDQSARLAAIIPSPLKRKPARMNDYSAVILDRMTKTGW